MLLVAAKVCHSDRHL